MELGRKFDKIFLILFDIFCTESQMLLYTYTLYLPVVVPDVVGVVVSVSVAEEDESVSGTVTGDTVRGGGVPADPPPGWAVCVPDGIVVFTAELVALVLFPRTICVEPEGEIEPGWAVPVGVCEAEGTVVFTTELALVVAFPTTT